MAHLFSLALFLTGLWLLLSGYYTALLLSFGAASVLLVVTIARRMDIADHEGVPLQMGHRIVLYWPWLIIEIIKANIDVTKRVLNPSLP
ncbi:MAG: Na+/H+ antiporter subunit E, partial [Alphaproteobacteria bacterium]